MVALAVELQIDAAVYETVAIHPRAEASVAQQIGRALLDDAGALPGLAVVAVADFQYDGLDAGKGEQMRQQQAGRSAADDPYLGTVEPSPSHWTVTAAPDARAGTARTGSSPAPRPTRRRAATPPTPIASTPRATRYQPP